MSDEIPRELYAHMIKPIKIESVEEKPVEVKEQKVEVVKPQSLDIWADKTNEVLRKGNSDYEVIKKSDLKTIRPKSFIFWKVFSILLLAIILVSSGLFIYYLQDGKFQAIVSNNNTMDCPAVNIPTCPTITCPSCNCPSLSCATNQTPQINVNLANLNCTTR
jgi:hypothetical protein